MQSRSSSSAVLGVPGEVGEMVCCDTTVEHGGHALISFVGRAISFRGKSLAHLCGRDLVLDIDGGSALLVTIIRFDDETAILRLTAH